MTECQGCGASNDRSRALCVLCGAPLAETDEWDPAAELPPLPPLPDGGLSRSMPAWLRDLPRLNPDTPPAPSPPIAVVLEHPPPSQLPPSLGAHADPRTFLTDDDFPGWLRGLAARADRLPVLVSASTVIGDGSLAAADRVVPPVWPALPRSDAPRPEELAPVSAIAIAEQLTIGRSDALAEHPPIDHQPAALPPRSLPPAAVLAAPAPEDRRQRERWETLLLVLLFIGVVVAALWALVANGVLSPSL